MTHTRFTSLSLTCVALAGCSLMPLDPLKPAIGEGGIAGTDAGGRAGGAANSAGRGGSAGSTEAAAGSPSAGGAVGEGGGAGVLPSDRTAPTVLAVTPEGGATDVSTHDSVRVTFSELVDETTISGRSFMVMVNSRPIPGTFAIEGETATFTPDSPMVLAARYDVVLTEDITDVAGNGLADAPVAWSFTTNDGVWGATMNPQAGDQDARNPRVAIDDAGNAIMAWDQNDGARRNIWVNRYTPATGWATPTMIGVDAGGDASSPSIAMDTAGNAVVAWSQSDGTRANIWSNIFAPGSGWGEAALIETDNTGDAYAPAVALDPSGAAVVVWQQSDGTRSNVVANRFTLSDSWGTATPIEVDNDGDAYSPQVGIDASGAAVALWEQYSGGRLYVYSNRFVPSSGWGNAALLDTQRSGSSGPSIAVDPSGSAIAVWQQSDGAGNLIWASRFVADTGWGDETPIETATGASQLLPSVAVDPTGVATAVWGKSNGTGIDTWANRFVPDSGWGTPAKIAPNAADACSAWRVRLDSAGNGQAVWQCRSRSIWSIRFVASSGWAQPVEIHTADGTINRPDLALNSTGSGVLVWPEYQSTHFVVRARTFHEPAAP